MSGDEERMQKAILNPWITEYILRQLNYSTREIRKMSVAKAAVFCSIYAYQMSGGFMLATISRGLGGGKKRRSREDIYRRARERQLVRESKRDAVPMRGLVEPPA